MKYSLNNLLIMSTITVSLSFLFFMNVPSLRYSGVFVPPVKNISPKAAYEHILDDPKSVLLIDVRTPGEYATAHASSSLLLSIADLYESKFTLPKNNDKDIYILCSGGRLASIAYVYLQHYGYRNIAIIDGGLRNWIHEDMPTIYGENLKLQPEDFFLDKKI